MTIPSSLPSPSAQAALGADNHPSSDAAQLSAALTAHMADAINQAGGWLGFDHWMALALYTPGLGYYANGSTKFGALPQGLRAPGASPAAASQAPSMPNTAEQVATPFTGAGSDFVTAPEMTPLFGYALARQVAQALQATQTFEIWEFGAGTGALARQLLDALQAMGQRVDRYTIVDLSESLKARQRECLAPHAHRVHWARELPQALQGVVLGNEVLDAMPVQLLARVQGQWFERGVALQPHVGAAPAHMVWADRPTDLRPPIELEGTHDYLTEIHPQAEAFVRTLAERLQRGACFLLDYGFPEAEYYHPQRHMGTVMCHRAHQADADPLRDVGLKDITAHVNFTGIALAAQDAGLEVLGYTSQAHFLMNCGLVELMESAPVAARAMAQKLILEHEMGELFKVIGLVKGPAFDALGFARGDRTYRL